MAMNTPSIRVCVATHKPYRMPSDPMYLPLHVGAALHPNACPGMQPDSQGQGISNLNASYSELTGLYWLWKNCDCEVKGLVQYRRLLGSARPFARLARDPYERVLGSEELLGCLREAPVVVAKRRNYHIETVYDHYAHTFTAHHFDECRKVLQQRHPSYVPSWDGLMAARGAHICNIFVMRSDLFDSYCAWMFDVIDELVRRVDSSGLDAFQARWPGRVSERLLDPWIIANGLDFTELPVVHPEPVDWAAKGAGFLAAKFLGKKYERSF